MNIILMGAPGSGKGTMAERLINKYDVVHLSTGDMLRENISDGTELGKLAKEYIDNGQLVPDDVIIGMVENKLNSINGGVLFDGFPRTAEQAKVLLSIAEIDAVIELVAPYEVVRDRVMSRMVCDICERVYNTTTYKSDVCEVCGHKLTHRNDDTLETIKKRFDVYEKYADDIKKIFMEKGLLYSINAVDKIDNIVSEISDILDKRRI